MDSLTHLILGHSMGIFAGHTAQAVQTGAYWGALVGNSLPDIDVPAGHLVGRGWAFHRKFTHTLPGVLGLSLAAAGVITLAIPGAAFWVTLGWTLLGCGVHVGLDCLNVWGTRPLWPFSDRVVGVGVLFIMDPLILGTLGLASLVEVAGWVGPELIRWLYASMWVYIAGRWVLKAYLSRRLIRTGALRSTVAPFLLGFRYFRETETHLEYGRVALPSGRLMPIESVPAARGPVVDASRLDPRVQALLRGARYPYATVEPMGEQYRVIWQDLFLRIRGIRRQVEVLVSRDLTPMT